MSGLDGQVIQVDYRTRPCAKASTALTVQSAIEQGPPVSAMMLALTDIMYAICSGQRVSAHINGRKPASWTGFTHSWSLHWGPCGHDGRRAVIRKQCAQAAQLRFLRRPLMTILHDAGCVQCRTVRKVTVPALSSVENLDRLSASAKYRPTCVHAGATRQQAYEQGMAGILRQGQHASRRGGGVVGSHLSIYLCVAMASASELIVQCGTR